MTLIYENGDLFSSVGGVIRAHACNSQGVWGRGIAVAFKSKYPEDYKEYAAFCSSYNYKACGKSLITSNLVGCMVTSEFYGQKTSNPDKIIENTAHAIDDLILKAKKLGVHEIHSNMFNSGLFNVPWHMTEQVIVESLKKHPDIKWVVWVKK
jgi:ADP-ribose 1''-phosphate phosphatase